MPVNLSPAAGAAAQFFTDNGVPLAGGLIYTYAAGTTTPQAAYTSSTGGTAWSNPIVLNSAGRVSGGGEIWLTEGAAYKFVLYDSTSVLIATYDQISGVNDQTNLLAFEALLAGSTGSSLVGFLQSGTGAVATTVQTKLRETVSPEDFGAVGDGSTNDTTALQNALNTGKTVRGTSGATYYINPLTQSTARQIIDMRGCTLTLRPAQSSYMLSLSGAGAQVLGGVWDGNKAAGQTTTNSYYDHAAVCILADYCRVDSITSQNSAGIGIKGSLCNYALVTNNEVTDWNVQGIYIESVTADAYGNRIENNVVTVNLNTGVGIYITGSNSPFTYKQKRWVVANNVVTGPATPAVTDLGITCRAVDGVVSGNVVTDCDLGITLDITSRTAITGNRVEFTGTAPTGYCYEINGEDNTFSGNISTGGKYGYVSAGSLSCDGNNITGNVFELQTVNAIYFNTTVGSNTANYLTISGNTFNFASAGAARTAIYLTGDCRYSVISGNNFIGPGSSFAGGRGIFFDTGLGDLHVASNRFQGWQRPLSLYSAGASTYNNVFFVGNDCSKDMLTDTNWIGLEGSAAYGTGVKQMWNSAGGFQEINYVNRATNLLMMWNASGTPEGAITAAVGSLYMNTAGGAGTVLYVKQVGTGNTGWGAK